ncbi:MAG: TatA/E family twin arginine-targeting protein translocase [Synechococcus sp.]
MNIFGVGLPEMILILAVALLVFGPKRLPEIGRSIAKTLKMLQDASKEFETELKKEADSLSAMVEDKPQAESTTSSTGNAKDSPPESLPKGEGEPDDGAADETDSTAMSVEGAAETGDTQHTETEPAASESDNVATAESDVEPPSEKEESPLETEVS